MHVNNVVENSGEPKPIVIIFDSNDSVSQGKQGAVRVSGSSRQQDAEVFAFQMCSIETEDRTAMCKSTCRCCVADKQAQKSIVVGVFDNHSAAGVGSDNIRAILRKLSIGILMRTIDLADSIFFSAPSCRITYFDALFSAGITYKFNRAIFVLILILLLIF